MAVISMKNPVHCAVALITCLLQIAALFVLLRSPFLAVVQVFIYVGAVMVLILFVILVLNIGKETLSSHVHGQIKYAVPVAVVLFFVAAVLVIKGAKELNIVNPGAVEQTTERVGTLLFTQFIFPFEVVSILLLVALVGAIVLVIREKR